MRDDRAGLERCCLSLHFLLPTMGTFRQPSVCLPALILAAALKGKGL